MLKKTALTALMFTFLAPQTALAANLSVSPTTGTFNKSCNFSVEVKVDTQGSQTDGVDAIIFYDPAKLTAKGIRNGTIFSEYPGNEISAQNSKIIISGLSSSVSAFTGNGTLATIDFQVKEDAAVGVTQLKFDFDPADKGKTIDSNVAERGTVTDLLGAVTDGSYTIGTGACSSATTPSGSTGTIATNSGQLKQPVGNAASKKIGVDEVVGGKPGTFDTTVIIGVVGSILTLIGILSLAFL